MKRRILLVLTSLLMLLSLVACGKSEENVGKGQENKVEDTEEVKEDTEEVKEDTEENVLSTLSDWGCPWVEANDSRIVLNFPGQVSSGAGGGKSITYDSGVAVVTANFPEDKGKISDVKEIYTTYEDNWKKRVEDEVQDIYDYKISNEEDITLNGYKFHKIEGVITGEDIFRKDDDPNKYSELPFVYYATVTRHEGNVPLYFFVIDATHKYRNRGENLDSKADVIEEYADNMAKSLREYSGGSQSYTDYGVWGKDLPLH